MSFYKKKIENLCYKFIGITNNKDDKLKQIEYRRSDCKMKTENNEYLLYEYYSIDSNNNRIDYVDGFFDNIDYNNLIYNLMSMEIHKNQVYKWKKEHKDDIKNYYKDRYINNREKLLEKVRCECGTMLTKGGMKYHLSSKKHINLINKNKII